jgi:hypothetical protein
VRVLPDPSSSGTSSSSGDYSFAIGGARTGVTSSMASMSSSGSDHRVRGSGLVAGADSFVHLVFTFSGGRVPYRITRSGTAPGRRDVEDQGGLVILLDRHGRVDREKRQHRGPLGPLAMELVVGSALTCNCFAFPASESSNASLATTFGQP